MRIFSRLLIILFGVSLSLIVLFASGFLAFDLTIRNSEPPPTAITQPTQEITKQALAPLPSAALPSMSAQTSTPILPTSTHTPEPTTTTAPTMPPTPSPTWVPYGFSRSIGSSHQNRDILAYQFKNGPNKVLFVGGIHGGFEWNTITLAYKTIDYFSINPDAVPDEVTLIIIPSANPDGQFRVTQKEGPFFASDVNPDEAFLGRFNAIGVDLNRNWDCDWTEDAVWRNQPVNAGTEPFSEPETRMLRDYILEINPRAVIFWHSAADGIYGARCPEPYQPSLELGAIYGEAANYPVHEYFDNYPINGDASDWLVTQEIPSFTVELQSTKNSQWPQNIAGMLAVLNYYAQSDETLPK